MTRREVSTWSIHHGISLSPEEADDILRDANNDPEEGANWLPYYKAAAGRLAELVGLLTGLLERHNVSINDERIATAKRLWELHLLLASVGPNPNIARSVEVRGKVAAAVEECFGKLAEACK